MVTFTTKGPWYSREIPGAILGIIIGIFAVLFLTALGVM